MNPDRQLHGSFFLMLAVQTIGALDMPGKGKRKLPSPRTYVAAIVVWAILGLVSDAGASRAAAVMGWVTVLTATVVGPFSKGILNFFDTVSTKFIATPSDTGEGGATGGRNRGAGTRGGGPGPTIA